MKLILDECLDCPEMRQHLKWWPGSVHAVTDAEIGAPRSTKDEDLPNYLRHHKDAVFVTVNKRDFYGRMDGQPSFCIIEVHVGSDDYALIGETLRRVLRTAPFTPARVRNGLVIKATRSRAEYHRRRHEANRNAAIELPDP